MQNSYPIEAWLSIGGSIVENYQLKVTCTKTILNAWFLHNPTPPQINSLKDKMYIYYILNPKATGTGIKALRYCCSSCSVPGVAGWLGVAGCGFPTISTCGDKGTSAQPNVTAGNNNARTQKIIWYLGNRCSSCGDESRLCMRMRLLLKACWPRRPSLGCNTQHRWLRWTQVQFCIHRLGNALYIIQHTSHQPGAAAAAPPAYAPICAAPTPGKAATLASARALKVVPSIPEYSLPSWLYVTAAPCWYTVVSVLWIPPEPFWAVWVGSRYIFF